MVQAPNPLGRKRAVYTTRLPRRTEKCGMRQQKLQILICSYGWCQAKIHELDKETIVVGCPGCVPLLKTTILLNYYPTIHYFHFIPISSEYQYSFELDQPNF
jgi:hypothetical protein